jgi:hypothetical protein
MNATHEIRKRRHQIEASPYIVLFSPYHYPLFLRHLWGRKFAHLKSSIIRTHHERGICKKTVCAELSVGPSEYDIGDATNTNTLTYL